MHVDNLVGQTIGVFKVEEQIGKGGMAVVYRAHQSTVKRDIALKAIQIDATNIAEENFHARFEQEARVVASLEHIHILPIYDYGIHENIVYLAMRYLSGGTLSEKINNGPLPLTSAVEIFTQTALGLAYAHSKGVIHRDIKPANIMIDDEGNIMLADFGLAKLITVETEITQSGNIVGTPAYMSPEQLRGDILDHRSDIYSIGVVLYEILTGKAPFEASNADVVSIIYKHLEKDPEPPSKHNADIPEAVDAVILKAMSKNPDDRYQSIGEMSNAFRTSAGMTLGSESFPAVNVKKITQLQKALRGEQNSRIMMALAMTVIAALVAVVFVLSLNNDSPETFQNATILDNESGTVEDTIPTENEISIAQKRLADDGFIAMIACNRESEYHSGVAREVTDFLSEHGIETRIYDSQNDETRQIPLIEQARSDGAAGLIICPLNVGLLDEVLTSIENRGTPLVLFSPGEDGHAYGGTAMSDDNYALGLKPGQFAGKYITEEMGGEADVLILDYSDLPIIIERANGLEDGVLEFAPDANIIGRYRGATQEFAIESITGVLEDDIEFDIIVSINDAGSYGAITALESAGFQPDDVKIISIDAEALAREYIREGNFIIASVAISRTETSLAMSNAMIKLLAGGTLPEFITSPVGDMVTQETLTQ